MKESLTTLGTLLIYNLTAVAFVISGIVCIDRSCFKTAVLCFVFALLCDTHPLNNKKSDK